MTAGRDPAAGPATPPGLPQRGRENETSQVREALECARAGGRALVSVVGPRGVGKTRLLYEATADARRLGFRLMGDPGRPPSRSTPPPAAPWPTLVLLDEPPPGPGGPGRAEPPPRAYGDRSHTVWLVAHRPDAVPRMSYPVTADARTSACTIRLTLGPLPEPAAFHLATDLLGAPPARSLQRLLRQTGGHPRLLIELLQGLRDEGSVRTEDGVARLVAAHRCEQARFYVREILGRCSGLCRQLLCVMAVVDQETAIEDLGLMMDTSTASLIVVLEEAYGTGLIRDDGTRPGFGSVLARCLVAGTVPTTLQSALRREAAALRRTRGGATTVRAEADGAAVHGGDFDAASGLSELQRDIVRLVGEGLSNQRIAERVGLSPHTVNYHLRKLYRALGVNSRIDLLNAAERAGGRLSGLPRAGRGRTAGDGRETPPEPPRPH
ncbi:LuxR C-terminal-related transcriptional regulator [Streptomyces sp. DT171]|uniref:LuxR C-terminal-related transcriptional regulator n=1 Tax=Streptomyces sp. DT171 TaxID=3416524 RepID=UPI003CED732A